MHKLVHGALTFRRQIFAAYRDLFQRLAAEGQSPQALFIGCSDSRVVPSLITQSDPGDLFIVRNVGNLVPPADSADSSVASAIEFAVSVLGVGDIIVCGHTRCGAMRTLLDGKQFPGALGNWLEFGKEARALLETYYGDITDPAERLEKLCQVNVLLQLDRLRAHPVIARALADGKVHLHGWLFDVATAQVSMYQPDEERFIRLEDSQEAPPLRAGKGRQDAA